MTEVQDSLPAFCISSPELEGTDLSGRFVPVNVVSALSAQKFLVYPSWYKFCLIPFAHKQICKPTKTLHEH